MKRHEPDLEGQLKNARPGDILLFHHATGINLLITMFSHSRYYHVGIYAGGLHVVESRPSGVQKRDLRKPGSGQYFRVIPAPGGRAVGEKALAWASKQIGDGYAVFSVFALVFDRLFRTSKANVEQRGKFSCGELVVKAFGHAGIQLFPGIEDEVVAPWDFAEWLPGRKRGRLKVAS